MKGSEFTVYVYKYFDDYREKDLNRAGLVFNRVVEYSVEDGWLHVVEVGNLATSVNLSNFAAVEIFANDK